MKASELRIGNWIYDYFDGMNVVVWGIDTNHDAISINRNHGASIITENLRHLKPIPLTEEWLLKFGFDISEDDPIRVAKLGTNPVNHDSILVLKNCDPDTSFGTWFYRNGHHEMLYVHQLQNLYFALTGEELEIIKTL